MIIAMRLAFWKKHLRGFSLIELSLVLLIMGVMAGAVLKGRGVLDQARARAVAQDFIRLQSTVLLYVMEFDPDNRTLAENTWHKLFVAKLLPNEAAPTSKFGGHFAVVHDAAGGYYLRLGEGDMAQEPILTGAQVRAVCARLPESTAGAIRVCGAGGDVVDSLSEASEELYTLAMRID